MIQDIFGTKRMKIALHAHTTLSDGRKTPEEVAQLYKAAGYDALALTDHWVVGENGEISGLRIISGCEYNIGADTAAGVYHILGIGYERDPEIDRETNDPQEIIDKINAVGGIAILAHPAWSLNSVEQVKKLSGIGATEIYNTISGMFSSDRPYSGEIVDLLANAGMIFPLTAADDSHHYTGDEAVSYILLDIDDGRTENADIVEKIKNGDFIATQGPQLKLEKTDEGIICRCTPACEISFFSSAAWNGTRVARGNNLSEAIYKPSSFEKWLRAEVKDAEGRTAWSSVINI